MKQEKVLLAGCGDLGIRLAGLLPASAYQCYGLRRRVELLPKTILPFAGDLRGPEIGARIAQENFDVVIASLTPDERSEAGYRRSYVDGAQALVDTLQQAQRPPRLVLWVSSTSVFGQDSGEWIDESAVAQPDSVTAQQLLAAEAVIRQAPCPVAVVRFSGIYGPNRNFMLNQVRRGDATPLAPHYTNRIHADDCARVLAHLMDYQAQRIQQSQQPEQALHDLYLGSDNEPVLNADVRSWLAQEMGVNPPLVANTNQVSGKRCRNQRLLETGFVFSFPTYREGYGAILNEG